MIQPSGILLVNKPAGITSNNLIQKIKHKLNIKKIGHAGTLDPLATGLMVILVNQATKISNYLLTKDKAYEVVMQLFIKTDSDDITGAMIEQEVAQKLRKRDIKLIIDKYNGYMYEQLPPIFSAIKVNGVRAYKHAFEGTADTLVLSPRTVTINSCKLINYDSKNNTITLTVKCSKGTYIRSLVNDIANDLGTIATVKELNRISSGEFLLEQAKTIEEIQNSDLISIYDALMTNSQVIVKYHNDRDVKQGKTINLLNQIAPVVFIADNKNNIIAIYTHTAKNLYVCKRGLWEDDPSIIKTEAESDDYQWNI
ncbi:tRNA pseudouridine(55) synthase TruB [Spiroplasma endosymbiont of Labia minor]|uniref:tRNA pseudouridine(55) synthase TruB n=1 Tax=Spiroplasma endosymbiont of Labia minor TaxID=3066305 RepID=UPI0030CBFEC5